MTKGTITNKQECVIYGRTRVCMQISGNPKHNPNMLKRLLALTHVWPIWNTELSTASTSNEMHYNTGSCNYSNDRTSTTRNGVWTIVTWSMRTRVQKMFWSVDKKRSY